eukprot:CAMPEP_0175056442 /NCGR_PEP_ID=MMETSP0052_2-20121109/10671_1 /TAXON_ID=51329 ORGANISM="Polytomella parva, Strain SAG 63-3" /NCGR_SAMPLE_ID=MMETSP0052_2 /ASSEMBLY_ACC=CAM_ASM_000194 /LENGTH=563 /DNA_ID=CAMNT_0016321465 /DNA_START=80 /DNA_END=1768 /DNA_ORIENTATION=-
MSSALASQLQQVAQQARQGNTVKRGKASLLFSPRKAADIDAQTIYEISKQGFDKLLKKDSRLYPFSESLYAQASVSLQRDQLTQQSIDQLNNSVNAFLEILTNYFMDPDAFKALEYLIRKYKIHTFNVDNLLLCGLPYHTTSQFLVLLKIVDIDNSLFGFLAGVRQSDTPILPRTTIAQRCLKDKALFHLIADAARRQSQSLLPSAAFLSFFAALACEVASAAPALSAGASLRQEFVAQLLPYIVSGLEFNAASDYRSAVFMMLAELSGHVTFSSEFLTAIIRSLEALASSGAAEGRSALLLLARLAVTQPGLTSLKAGLAERAASLTQERLAQLSLRRDADAAAAAAKDRVTNVSHHQAIDDQVAKAKMKVAADVHLAGQAIVLLQVARNALRAKREAVAAKAEEELARKKKEDEEKELAKKKEASTPKSNKKGNKKGKKGGEGEKGEVEAAAAAAAAEPLLSDANANNNDDVDSLLRSDLPAPTSRKAAKAYCELLGFLPRFINNLTYDNVDVLQELDAELMDALPRTVAQALFKRLLQLAGAGMGASSGGSAKSRYAQGR